jgi:hypothetical protein
MTDYRYHADLHKVFNRIFRRDAKLVSVTFPKADGTLRTMVLKKSDLSRFVNPNADPNRAAGARQRDINYPNLVRVMEYVNGGQPRTLDLDKVRSITCNGKTEHVIRGVNGVEFLRGPVA